MSEADKMVGGEDLDEVVARRIYEDAHKGMRNIWGWDDGGLHDEHPGTRERFLGYARSAIAALAAATDGGGDVTNHGSKIDLHPEYVTKGGGE